VTTLYTLTPRTGASQYVTQQAGPRLISTFFLIWTETQGDRVDAVAFVGYTNDQGRYLSSERKEAKEPFCDLTFDHMLDVTPKGNIVDLGPFHA